MERNSTENVCYSKHVGSVNALLAQRVIEAAIRKGIREFCVAAGSRNAPLVYALAKAPQVKVYYWPEERSASFFALGRIKATDHPVAVVTTSGTAAAELLPATMNAHYLGLPLLLLTADRPRRFRGSGAPQTAEQVGLFGCYAHLELDVEGEEAFDLSQWNCRGPTHLNVCFEEPNDVECRLIQIQDHLFPRFELEKPLTLQKKDVDDFHQFLDIVRYPLVVVGGLHPNQREQAVQFILNLNAPVYAEGFSGLREERRLAHLRITRIDQIWQISEKYGYPIDGILRIGEIPTARLWRDLEAKEGKIHVCSISEQPFSGLSWSGLIHTSLNSFFSSQKRRLDQLPYQNWLEADKTFQLALSRLFKEEPWSEPGLFHQLSSTLPQGAQVYLGNSLPIREWDLAATYEDRKYGVTASRGLNGIDGQISTFLGLSKPGHHNWAILGDLTAVYDLAGPWILNQMQNVQINLVIVNNRGGQIFSRMYPLPQFLNLHDLEFSHLAGFWGMAYEKWTHIPANISTTQCHRLIEIIPDANSTHRFWKKMALL